MTTGDCPETSDFLFVYGTLRRGCSHHLACALEKTADWLGRARVQGHLLNVDGDYPALMLDPSGMSVIGDLFHMHDPATMLARLDAYEECTPDHARPWEYRREIVELSGDNGPLLAWTYVYNWPVDDLAPIASGDWLKR